jgi:drug/metabolite transporter (DMT)-like permease
VSPRLLGTLLALTSAAGFGVMPVLTKVAYDDGASVAGVLSVRFSIAAVLLLVLSRVRGEVLPRGRKAGQLLLLGGVGYVVESACYFAALTRISAGLTALLLYAYPALVVLITAVVARRAPGRVGLGCVAVASAGTALTIGPVAGGQWTGVVLGLCAALCYSAYIVVSAHVVSGLPPFATSAVVMAGAGLVYDGYALSTRAALPSTAEAWWAVLGVALLGTVVAVGAFFWALELLGPADTAVISTFEPVVSVVAGAVFLSESLTALQVAGGALVLSAVAVLARSPGSSPAVPLDVG